MDFDFFQADAYWHALARIKSLHLSNGELELNPKHRSQMTISAVRGFLEKHLNWFSRAALSSFVH